MPRVYKLYYDRKNSSWFKYTTDPETKKRTKHYLGKATSKTNHPEQYKTALERWREIDSSHNKALASITKPKRRAKNPTWRPLTSMWGLYDRYIQYQYDLVQSDRLQPGTFSVRKRTLLAFFNNFLGEKKANYTADHSSGGAPSIINSQLMLGYHKFLMTRVNDQEITIVTATNCFGILKGFIKYVVGLNDAYKIPNNFFSPVLQFRKTRQARLQDPGIQILTKQEIQDLLQKSLEHHSTLKVGLWIALSLNCAWTTVEIATLKIRHIKEFHNGFYIDKPREKTLNRCQWILWPELANALNSYISTRWGSSPDPEQLVFTTETDTPLQRWVYEKNGEKWPTPFFQNLIYYHWRQLFTNAGVNKQYKYIRATSATAIEGLSHNHQLTQKYLGHIPTTIAGKHYSSGLPQEEIDKHILMLVEYYGIQKHLIEMSSIIKTVNKKQLKGRHYA